MIEVKNLTKRYGDKLAVNDLSFTVNKGEILGFLGPNGAGKSTVMNILTGYLSSTAGSASVAGFDVLEEPIEAKKHIGYLPELPPLYMDMTVKAYLDFIYDLKKVSLPRKQHISEICEVVKISHVYNRIIKNLSKGYKQRVGLAAALIGNPDVLILDEPTVGLDPQQIIEIRKLIRSLGEKHTVILSSHILPEVQAVCDRVIVINKGKLIANDTPDNLSSQLSADHRYVLRVAGPQNDVLTALKGIRGMEEVVHLGVRENGAANDYSLECERGVDIRYAVFERMCERHWPILSLRSSEMTLEDIFLQLVNEENNPGGDK